MGKKPYFLILFSPFHIKAIHPFQEERSLGKEGGFFRCFFFSFSSRVTKSTFSPLLCCAVRFETLCPENNTQLSYFILMLSTALSLTLRIMGCPFKAREQVAPANMSQSGL